MILHGQEVLEVFEIEKADLRFHDHVDRHHQDKADLSFHDHVDRHHQEQLLQDDKETTLNTVTGKI